MTAIREKETVQLMFNCCICTSVVKLNIKWQMAFILIKINLDKTDSIVLLAASYWVKNSKLCNKHLFFLTRHIGLIIQKIPVGEFISSLDSIQQHEFLERFRKLVIEKLKWFVVPLLQTMLRMVQIIFSKRLIFFCYT